MTEPPEFLSREWVGSLAARLESSTDLGTPASPICIEYRISDDDGIVVYHVVVGNEGATAALGAAAGPTVTFTTDRATAAAIGSGELSAEEAFITGRLDLEGDASVIIEAQRAARDA